MSINEWMDKEIVVYIYNEILFYHKKEWSLPICDNINGCWGHCAKWTKSDKDKHHTPYDLSYKWNLNSTCSSAPPLDLQFHIPWFLLHTVSSVQFSHSVVSDSATSWIAAHQASLSITNFRSSLRSTSIESVMPSSHLILCRPLLSCPQSLPASEYFPVSQLFAWGGQSTGVSALASFLPKTSQGWSSEWTGWISLQSKGLSRVFSNTTVQKHQFFGAQPSS